MQRPTLSRNNQALAKGKTVRLAVIGHKHNPKSSSDPNRGDDSFTKDLIIQNSPPKVHDKSDISPLIVKDKTSQIIEPEFNLVPAILANHLQSQSKIIDNLTTKIVNFDYTENTGAILSKNEKKTPVCKNEYRTNLMVSHFENIPGIDKSKANKLLKPIEYNKLIYENITRNRGKTVEKIPRTPEANNDQLFSQEENEDFLGYPLRLETRNVEGSCELLDEEANNMENQTGQFCGRKSYTQEILSYSKGVYKNSESNGFINSLCQKESELTIIEVQKLMQDTNEEIYMNQKSSANNPFLISKRTSRVRNFRIQNSSPQKLRLRCPTSPHSLSQSNQGYAQKDEIDNHQETRFNNAMWLNHNTALINENYLKSLKSKGKKSISPSKLRRDPRYNHFTDKNKIEEIKQLVLNSEPTNSHLKQNLLYPPKGAQNNYLLEDNLLQDIEDSAYEEDEAEESSQTSRSYSKKVFFLESVYSGRPPTVFFPYPSCCEQVRDMSRARPISLEEDKLYEFKYKAPRLLCLRRTFEAAGFKNTDDSSWNVLWAQPKYERIKDMNKYQKTNHFPGCWEVGRKDGLWRNLSKMRRQFPNDYNFVPNTYLLSTDYERFIQIKENADNKAIWIMKPCASACGRGIKIINKATKLPKNPNYLVSEYISNPHLIDGLKYDLRVYVLASSYDPLRIYIFKEGLVRFATEKYSTKKKNLKLKFAHLTNWSVNKHSSKFVKNQGAENDGEGSKWSFSALRRKFEEMNISYENIFNKIKDIIIKTLISVEPFMLSSTSRAQEHRSNCFELYGFDILLDSNLKAWLMEVNVCASLNSSSPLDRKIKTTLICDMMNLIGIQPYIKKKLEEESKNKLLGIDARKHIPKNYYDLFDLDETNCLEKLSVDDWNILFEIDEEWYRKGNFERIFPEKENINIYAKFFEYQRYNNILVWQWLQAKTNFLEKISQKISTISA